MIVIPNNEAEKGFSVVWIEPNPLQYFIGDEPAR